MSFEDEIKAARPAPPTVEDPRQKELEKIKKIQDFAAEIASRIKEAILDKARNTPDDGKTLYIDSYFVIGRFGSYQPSPPDFFSTFITFVDNERKGGTDFFGIREEYHISPYGALFLDNLKRILICDKVYVKGFALMLSDQGKPETAPARFPVIAKHIHRDTFNGSKSYYYLNGSKYNGYWYHYAEDLVILYTYGDSD